MTMVAKPVEVWAVWVGQRYSTYHSVGVGHGESGTGRAALGADIEADRVGSTISGHEAETQLLTSIDGIRVLVFDDLDEGIDTDIVT